MKGYFDQKKQWEFRNKKKMEINEERWRRTTCSEQALKGLILRQLKRSLILSVSIWGSYSNKMDLKESFFFGVEEDIDSFNFLL